MKVYLLCSEVDLGYHVKSVHYNKEIPEKLAKEKTEEYNKKYSPSDWFFVQEYEVEE